MYEHHDTLGATAMDTWLGRLQYSLADLREAQQEFRVLTAADLCSFVAGRENGASDDIVYDMYRSGLREWRDGHTGADGCDSESASRDGYDPATLQYLSGLLYGSKLIEQAQQRDTGHPLLANDPVASRRALQAVKASYAEDDPLGGDGLTTWERERRREIRFTDGALLSMVNATLDDHIQCIVVETRAAQGLETASVSDVERLSLYRGMLDGVIYCNAFAQNPDRTVSPLSYPDVAEAGAENSAIAYQAGTASGGLMGVTFEAESSDDLSQVEALLDCKTMEKVAVGGGRGGIRVLTIEESVEQTGPNAFTPVRRIVADRLLDDIMHDRPLRNRVRSNVLTLAAVGALSAANAEVLTWIDDTRDFAEEFIWVSGFSLVTLGLLRGADAVRRRRRSGRESADE